MTARSRLLLVLVWVAGAVVATSIGLLAVRQVASSVGDPVVPVLSDGAVPTAPSTTASPAASAPAASTPATPTTTGPGAIAATPRATPTPVAVRSSRPAAAPPSARTSASFRSSGGTVGVQCSGSNPSLLYATPADGYALDESSVEGSQLEVRFEAGERRVKLTISCASGTPRLVEERIDGD